MTRRMRPMHYILRDGVPVAVDWLEWAQWFETHAEERVIARTYVGSVEVSTVFIGLDHQYGDGPPLIYETMIFGGVRDANDFRNLIGLQWRYSTEAEARGGHEFAVAMVRRDLRKQTSWWDRLWSRRASNGDDV